MEEMVRERMEELIDEMAGELDLALMTEKTARIIVQWALRHGHTKEEAYDLLVTTLGANVE